MGLGRLLSWVVGGGWFPPARTKAAMRGTRAPVPPLWDAPAGSCWALAVADAVAASTLVAVTQNGSVPQLVPDTIQQCSSDSEGGGCLGGLTPNALDHAVASGMRNTSRFSRHLTCSSHQAALAPYQVLTYESIQYKGWFGLLLAVSSQPVVVTLQGSYPAFQAWTSNRKHVSPEP